MSSKGLTCQRCGCETGWLEATLGAFTNRVHPMHACRRISKKILLILLGVLFSWAYPAYPWAPSNQRRTVAHDSCQLATLFIVIVVLPDHATATIKAYRT
jgi:hypothetical protein